MTPRFHTSRPDTWVQPRQHRPADFGWGRIEPMLSDDTLWSSIYSGMIWLNALVWGAAAVIAVFAWGQS